mmetsp:Transcript_8206/g.16608  ORF Transcript_8206/g.16608 Transcript_8206/m.16608 type:complete len:98 (-) Transcript_8206:120-413(-)
MLTGEFLVILRSLLQVPCLSLWSIPGYIYPSLCEDWVQFVRDRNTVVDAIPHELIMNVNLKSTCFDYGKLLIRCISSMTHSIYLAITGPWYVFPPEG